MDSNNKNFTTEELKEKEIWTTLLAILLYSEYIEAINIWQDFENEILHQNRFFPNDTHIRNIFECFTNDIIYTLPIGKRIFRARVVSQLQTELPEHTQKTLNDIKKVFPPDNQFPITNYTSFPNYLSLLHKYFENKDFYNFIKDDDKKLLNRIKESNFWGYSAKDSDAPPCDKAGAGRVNPNGVSYLYATENEHTAVVESRPIIGQIVSVAEIEIIKELKLFDFCNNISSNDNTKKTEQNLFNIIAERYSTPNYQGEFGYYSTQYIAEILKTQFNFDGIRFRSSLHKDGINIVLFNENKNSSDGSENYKIINSSLHFVENITIEQNKLLPFQG